MPIRIATSGNATKTGARAGRRHVLGGLAVAMSAALGLMPGLGAGPALAEYPERPIEMIVPWGAGGGTDAVGRIFAQLLQENPVAINELALSQALGTKES